MSSLTRQTESRLVKVAHWLLANLLLLLLLLLSRGGLHRGNRGNHLGSDSHIAHWSIVLTPGDSSQLCELNRQMNLSAVRHKRVEEASDRSAPCCELLSSCTHGPGTLSGWCSAHSPLWCAGSHLPALSYPGWWPPGGLRALLSLQRCCTQQTERKSRQSWRSSPSQAVEKSPYKRSVKHRETSDQVVALGRDDLHHIWVPQHEVSIGTYSNAAFSGVQVEDLGCICTSDCHKLVFIHLPSHLWKQKKNSWTAETKSSYSKGSVQAWWSLTFKTVSIRRD